MSSFTVSNLLRFEPFVVRNLTSKSLIIIRSVLLLQPRGLYLKILFLKRCETNISTMTLQVSTITLPLIIHKKTIKSALKLRSTGVPRRSGDQQRIYFEIVFAFICILMNFTSD